MKKYLSILLLSIVSLGITSCGGGGNAIPQVTIETDASAVAYSTFEDGEWQTDVGSGIDIGNNIKQYKVNLENAYLVALYCKQQKVEFLFMATQEENPYVYFKCPSVLEAITTYKGHIDDTAPVHDFLAVSMDTSYQIINTANGDYDLSPRVGNFDQVIVSLDFIAGDVTPQKFYIKRDIDLYTLGGTEHNDITLTNNNTHTITGKNFTQNAGTTGNMFLVTGNETYFKSSLDDHWYYPEGSLIDEDIYLLYRTAKLNRTFKVNTYDARTMPRKDITLDVSYIEPLTQVTYAGDSLNNLDLYTPNVLSPEFRGYQALLKNGTDRIYTIITNQARMNWKGIGLGGNLSAVEGFENAWDATNATEVYVSAVMSDVSFSTMLQSKRFLKLKDTDFYLVDGYNLEVAAQIVK